MINYYQLHNGYWVLHNILSLDVMEHAYNSGCMRTHSHQIQLDGGGKAQKKLYRYSSELQISKKPLKNLQQRHFGSQHSGWNGAGMRRFRKSGALRLFIFLSFLMSSNQDKGAWTLFKSLGPNCYHHPGEKPLYHLDTFPFKLKTLLENT